MLYTATTFKYSFDYREDDVYWCTADVGWITGHSYITYGPVANGATGIIVSAIGYTKRIARPKLMRAPGKSVHMCIEDRTANGKYLNDRGERACCRNVQYIYFSLKALPFTLGQTGSGPSVTSTR